MCSCFDQQWLAYREQRRRVATGCEVVQSFIPTCQVRVVRFYVRLLLLLLLLFCLLLLLRLLRRRAVSPPRPVFPVGPQLRPAVPSVPCRTSTATLCGQCSVPDLNRDPLRPVFPAGPQLRPAVPSVPCRTSTATICAQGSLPDLNREIECQKIC